MYDLTHLKAVLESKTYAVYTLGQINENLWKGIRLNKETKEQYEVTVQKFPAYRVMEVKQKVR